jgi:hypothetical protein
VGCLCDNSPANYHVFKSVIWVDGTIGDMIDIKVQKDIVKTTQKFWNVAIKTASFKKNAKGKEVGHRMADFIDEETTALLATTYKAVYHRTKNGMAVTRSMGDVWFPRKGVYHPINVKTSITGGKGQPNMVSLKKLLDALLDHKIDSYYLLIIRVSIGKKISCQVHLVDLLDYLDYMAYDSGPGQIMLKASAFFTARGSGIFPKKRTLGEKVRRLVDMLDDGDRRLAANRKRVLARLKAKAKLYDETHHVVTPETQAAFNFL